MKSFWGKGSIVRRWIPSVLSSTTNLESPNVDNWYNDTGRIGYELGSMYEMDR